MKQSKCVQGENKMLRKTGAMSPVAASLIALVCSLGTGGCYAESIWTITGVFKVGIDRPKTGSTSRKPNSEMRVIDEGSIIRFFVAEDFGDGLFAFWLLDWRTFTDVGVDETAGTHVIGLRNWNTFGRVRFGRLDLHYFHRESDLIEKAGSLKVDSISLLAHAGGGAFPIANASRTPNLIDYTSPEWGPLQLQAAYSTNPVVATEADIGSTLRKGRGWHVRPNFKQGGLQLGYSHWDAKTDALVAVGDQIGRRLYGSYDWGWVKVGFALDHSRFKHPLTRADLSNRWAWSLPAHYKTGRHNFYGHYTKARDDKVSAARDGAKMWGFAYAYDLSKQVSFGLSWGQITNDPGARYNFFTNTGLQGSLSAAVAQGEDPSLWVMSMRYAF
jgi:predicted porin